MNQSFGFKKGSFVIRGPLVSVVIPAIAFIYQIYSLLSSPFGSLPENFQGCTYITTKICKRNIEGCPHSHPSTKFHSIFCNKNGCSVSIPIHTHHTPIQQYHPKHRLSVIHKEKALRQKPHHCTSHGRICVPQFPPKPD